MTDEQDVSIALLKQRLEEAEKKLAEISDVAYSLRDDRLRIEGGKWVLWWLGGLFMTVAALWYYFSGLAPFHRFHGGN